ncbi:DUF748 domain-containing protein [Thalassotalea ganghwensis]
MKNKLLAASKYIAITLFSLLMLIWLLSPFIAQYAAQKYLTPLNLTLSGQSSIRYNPFTSVLSVRKLAITKAGKIVFALNQADLGISLYQLLFDRIYLKQFDVDGVYAKVIQQQQTLSVAGVELAGRDSATEQSSAASSNQSNDYELVLPELRLINSKIEIIKDQKLLTVLTPYLTIKNAKLTENSLSLNAVNKNTINQGSLIVNADINLMKQQGKIISNIEALNLDLSLLSPWLPKALIVSSAQLSLDSQQDITLIGDRKELTFKNNKILLEQLNIKNPQLAISADAFDLYSPNWVVSINDDDQLNLEGQGKLLTKYLAVSNASDDKKLLTSIRKIQSDHFAVSTPNLKPLLVIDNLNIDKVVVSDDTLTPEPPLTTLESITLDDVRINQDSLAINLIGLTDLKVNTTIAKDKSIANLASIASLTDVNKEAETAPKDRELNEGQQNNVDFLLNQLRLLSPAIINLHDTSVSPSYQRSYRLTTVELGPLDTRKPNLETSLLVKGESDHFEKFNLKSTNQLFTKTPSYSLSGDIKEIDLSALSPYIKQALKHEIKNGHLDLKLNTSVNNAQLSGNADLTLRRVDFMANVDIEDHAVKTTAGMPLNYALGMLKDNKGHVDLSIPLSGDLSDPKFGLVDITTLLIKKASMMAAKDYLLQTFVPYANVVSIALSAADHVLKVRFNDLEYQPKQVDAAITNSAYLEQFAKLLQDKPDTQVSICPIAVPQDINLTAGSEVKDPAIVAQLKAISMQRFNAFKKLMITQYNIESARLLLCSPSIDTNKNAQPRLTFSS